MAQKNSQLADAVTDLADATLIDLPLSAIGRLFNPSFDAELRKAEWKAISTQAKRSYTVIWKEAFGRTRSCSALRATSKETLCTRGL